ncbi:hypothetical protein PVAP13_7NG221600 [Panicum virgatum]|uniref:Uncharacterized protein n=1 Tax=Panicum virgatum TaxID=38727 RepID=A0A8T0Q831_PANVG|nr:hypothetical protein PVAP13_7NG221600 [Panicum virgatum]
MTTTSSLTLHSYGCFVLPSSSHHRRRSRSWPGWPSARPTSEASATPSGAAAALHGQQPGTSNAMALSRLRPLAQSRSLSLLLLAPRAHWGKSLHLMSFSFSATVD